MRGLERLIDTFGIKCLRRIMGHRWNDCVKPATTQWDWFDIYCITCIVRQHQLRLYGHVVRYPEADTAHWVVSVRDNYEWRRPRGCPQSSWLVQVNRSWQDLLRMKRGDRDPSMCAQHITGVMEWRHTSHVISLLLLLKSPGSIMLVLVL